MLKESLHIYTIDSNGNKTPFPSEQHPAVLSEWDYTAERMAGAPTITGYLMNNQCLDDLWTKKEFIEFNSERYYVDQTPTSSKNTADIRYKHDITFVSERIVLENVFFFDVVTSETEEQYKDRYRSNSTTFSFYGTLYEFVSRLNDSLIYSKLYNPQTIEGYHVVIDEGIPVEEVKELSFNGVYFATALQEIYNKYGISYYWIGKTCHVGYTENSIIKPFEYGSGNGLISINKNNENYRIVNRITGVGSSDNIPYYYPNSNEYGTLIYSTKNIDKSRVSNLSYPKIHNYNPSIYDTYIYCTRDKTELNVENNLKYYNPRFPSQYAPVENTFQLYPFRVEQGPNYVIYHYKSNASIYFRIFAKKGATINVSSSKLSCTTNPSFSRPFVFVGIYIMRVEENSGWTESGHAGKKIESYYNFHEDGWYQISMLGTISFSNGSGGPVSITIKPILSFIYNPGFPDKFFLYNNKKGNITYSESGITLSDVENVPSRKYICSFKDGEWVETLDASTSENAAQVLITDRKWIAPTGKLMPPIYRESNGAERFYNAINDTYPNPDGGTYSFNNLYTENNPMEGFTEFEDIKPSIKGMKNASGQLLGEIVAVAFDSDNSDETVKSDENNMEYVHSYFYVKLHIFNGKFGFNIFKQALESGAMTFNMTSGNCAGCAFEVGVPKPREVDGHYEFDNPVITDENGNLVKVQNIGDSKYTGDYIQKEGGEYTPRQQDTSKYSVWVALKKETSTYGIVMPNATNNYKPNAGDTFVITNILMPQVYITNAENELKESLIKYMSENNDEKFTFSMQFSRIYLQQHPEIEEMLNENARIVVRYNGHDYTLYVSSFSCKATDDILNEITVEVTDKLSVGKSALRDKVSEAVNDEIDNISKDIISAGQRHFISKTQNDTAKGVITFQKAPIMESGAYFGAQSGQGYNGKVEADGSAELLSLILRESLKIGSLASVDKDGAAKLTSLILSGLNGLQSDNFILGALGSGFGLLKMDSSGHSYLEIDKLFVRMSALFTQLEIRSLKYSGGNFVFSPAGAQVKRVERCPAMVSVTDEDGTEITDDSLTVLTTDTGTGVEVFRCWFNTDDGEKSVVNEFAVGDLVRAQDFNIKEGVYDGVSNSFYWRKCVYVGPDFIDLSVTDCAEGSGEPKSGDDIVTMGNVSDVDRQNIIVINTIGDGAPEFVQYEKVNGYSLEGKMVTRISPKGNVFRGTFLLTTGKSVEEAINDSSEYIENFSNEVYSKFEVLDESIRQTVTKVEEYGAASELLEERISQAEIKLQPENIWIGIQQSESTRNIFQDGSFEYNLHTFEFHPTRTASVSDRDYKFGNQCLYIKCVTVDSETHWVRNVAITDVSGGNTYTFVFWIKGAGARNVVIYPRFVLEDGTTTELAGTSTSTGNTWKKVIITFDAPTNAIKFGFVVYNTFTSTLGTIRLDGMMLFEGDMSSQVESLERFIPCETDESEATIKTGINIKKREINVTTDQFNVYNNDGEKTASINADGVIETNGGVFNNVTVNGSISQPWVQLKTIDVNEGYEIVDENGNGPKEGMKYDNIMFDSSTQNVTDNQYMSRWFDGDASDIGRTVNIANIPNQGMVFPDYTYPITLTSRASDEGQSKYAFFDAGYSDATLTIKDEIVTLKGIGSGNVFVGWYIMERKKLRSKSEIGSIGRILACFNVYGNNTTATSTTGETITGIYNSQTATYKFSFPGLVTDLSTSIASLNGNYCVLVQFTGPLYEDKVFFAYVSKSVDSFTVNIKPAPTSNVCPNFSVLMINNY